MTERRHTKTWSMEKSFRTLIDTQEMTEAEEHHARIVFYSGVGKTLERSANRAEEIMPPKTTNDHLEIARIRIRSNIAFICAEKLRTG